MLLFTAFLGLWMMKQMMQIMSRIVSSISGDKETSAYNADVLSNIQTTSVSSSSSGVDKSGYLVLICGAVGSGKTRLFQKLLCDEENVSNLTVSSSIAAQGSYKSSTFSGSCDLLDYPGHSRLRSGLLNKSMLGRKNLKRILFIVDSSVNVIEAAEFLYDILLAVQNNVLHEGISILVCCNKADTKLAKNVKRIQLQMKTELNRLRGTRGTMDDSNGEAGTLIGGNQILGTKGVPLDWESMPCIISFISCSCETEQGINEIRTFIEGNNNKD